MVRALWAICSCVRAAGHRPLRLWEEPGEGQLPWKCEPRIPGPASALIWFLLFTSDED